MTIQVNEGYILYYQVKLWILPGNDVGYNNIGELYQPKEALMPHIKSDFQSVAAWGIQTRSSKAKGTPQNSDDLRISFGFQSSCKMF